MTDRQFRPAGWAAPAVLAPCAAAVFGASVWWATAAVPTTQAAQPAAPSAAAQNRSQAVQHYLAEVAHQRRVLHRELARALDARHHQAHVLTKRIHELSAEIAKAKAAASAAAAYQPPPVGYGAAPAGPAPVAPVRVAAVPAPAPPPVQANTGASGAVR